MRNVRWELQCDLIYVDPVLYTLSGHRKFTFSSNIYINQGLIINCIASGWISLYSPRYFQLDVLLYYRCGVLVYYILKLIKLNTKAYMQVYYRLKIMKLNTKAYYHPCFMVRFLSPSRDSVHKPTDAGWWTPAFASNWKGLGQTSEWWMMDDEFRAPHLSIA